MNRRVLIVEDDTSLRMTLERHLEEQGFRALGVDSAEAALAQWAEFRPRVVLMDIRLPGMTGLELLKKLRESVADVPAILITGHVEMDTAMEGIKAGAFDYLVKPLDLDVIDGVLARCLQQGASQPVPVNRDAAVAPTLTPTRSQPVLVGFTRRMVEVYKLIAKVSKVPVPVLIRGETGTGKEVVARLIHANSPFAQGPFLPVNCAALPEALLESELFGHIRGAFTGAVADRKGRFELAHHGTIFLDEIGDISPSVQVKLLRVLQDGEFQPVGSERSLRTGGRIVAATHRALEDLVGQGKFRDDLYFRLRVVEIALPPLRQRREEIPALVWHILGNACRHMGRAVPAISDRVMELLRTYEWPGNVRELENALTRAAVLAHGSIEPEHLSLGFTAAAEAPSNGDTPASNDQSLQAMELRHVQRILVKAGGSKTKAAAMLGISRPRLNRLLDKHRATAH